LEDAQDARPLYKDESLDAASTVPDSPEASISDSESSNDYDAPIEDECLISIRSAIDRLHRLAKAIRHPGIVSQASKANHFRPRDEFGNDKIGVFEDYSLKVIQQCCRGSADFLHHRLSKANASRRRLFLFRRKHQDVLNGRRNSSPKRRLSLSRQETQKTFSVMPDPGPKAIPIVSEPSKPRTDANSRVQSSIAKATSFVESQFKPDTSSKAASSIGGTSVASMLGQSRLPPPPKVPKTRAEFECPYCCQLLPTKILNKRLWRYVLRLMSDCVTRSTPKRASQWSLNTPKWHTAHFTFQQLTMNKATFDERSRAVHMCVRELFPARQ
jgi:hypothetical protein